MSIFISPARMNFYWIFEAFASLWAEATMYYLSISYTRNKSEKLSENSKKSSCFARKSKLMFRQNSTIRQKLDFVHSVPVESILPISNSLWWLHLILQKTQNSTENRICLGPIRVVRREYKRVIQILECRYQNL